MASSAPGSATSDPLPALPQAAAAKKNKKNKKKRKTTKPPQAAAVAAAAAAGGYDVEWGGGTSEDTTTDMAAFATRKQNHAKGDKKKNKKHDKKKKASTAAAAAAAAGGYDVDWGGSVSEDTTPGASQAVAAPAGGDVFGGFEEQELYMAAPVNAEIDYDLQAAKKMEAYTVLEPARQGVWPRHRLSGID